MHVWVTALRPDLGDGVGEADRREPEPGVDQGEDDQAEVEDGLAAMAVGKPTVGHLQDGLGEPVGPEGNPHQRQVPPRQALRVEREDRQDDEHAEEAQPEDRGKRKARSQLAGAHAGRGIHRNGGLEPSRNAVLF